MIRLKRWKEIRDIYCCAWCRGSAIIWIIWIVALGFDKWPGVLATTLALVGVSVMKHRKHNRDQQERMRPFE